MIYRSGWISELCSTLLSRASLVIASHVFVVLALVGNSARIATAAIVYVDATAANTAPGSAINSPTYTGASEGLWDIRPGYGLANTIFESNGAGAEDSPLITTTVTGLTAGTYEVYVFYDTLGSANWNVQAAISGNALLTYDKTNGIATGNTYASGQIIERQALLGTVLSAGSIAVDINDQGLAGGDARSWYDGVGYQLVPEPSSAAICIFALVTLGLFRKWSVARD